MSIIITILLILFILSAVLRLILFDIFYPRAKKKWRNMGGGFYYSSSTHDDSHKAEPKPESKDRKKIFAKDEGEYVDFEEIK